MGADVDDATAEVLQIWGEVLDDLARDPMETADRLDWTAKLRLLEGYRERDGLSWDAGRLALVDLQYSDVRMAKGLYNRLATRGSMQAAGDRGAGHSPRCATPPEDTRAYFRGRCLKRYPSRGGRRVVGLGDLRPGPRVAGADPHAGAAARHPAPRRRADRQLAHRRGAGGRPSPRAERLTDTARAARPGHGRVAVCWVTVSLTASAVTALPLL